MDGKKVAQTIKAHVSVTVRTLKAKTGVTPTLATVLVGDDLASSIYVKNKIKTTQECGMNSLHKNFDKGILQQEVIDHINALNGDRNVHGILVQLPLPKHLDKNQILNAVCPQKDVDGFHPFNVGLLVKGLSTLQPCTPSGVIALLAHYKISLTGKRALIIGRSDLVGKPLALMFLKENATVTIAHSQTRDLDQLAAEADIVVAAVGKAKMVRGTWIKKGATVIDVGINREANGSLCGDVEFLPAQERAAFITPVPGGVGPMTIAMLMKNTVEAYQQCLS